jgi:hypothetical protein
MRAHSTIAGATVATLVATLAATVAATLGVSASRAFAATSTRSVPSSLGGNGHNAAFDGRLYIVRTGPGWQAYVLRPEALTYQADGLPDATGPMWSSPLQILAGDPHGENALAICEPAPDTTPFACDAANAPSPGGPFACYDVWVFDADASRSVAQGGQSFRRRRLMLRVAEPGTARAQPVAFSWGAIEPVTSTAGALHGIELTTTRDGKLLVWNGSLNNGDQAGQMMYTVNSEACAATGWSPPRSLSHMVNDPAVNTQYELAMRQLRAADGTPYADGAAVLGAYPWLFQDGAAVIFAAALMPCRAADDPPGCGPRRNATSVIGAPTRWGLANIDGGINPSTTDIVRLFFSSPGDETFRQLPVTRGAEVYPFFGSNTANYVEVSFDDALDGNYLGFWHMNESVTPGGRIDVTRSPDTSGNFNTARVNGAIAFPGANNGVLGKAAVASGGWLEVAHDPSLEPTDAITMEMTIRPAGDPDCDADNNFRFLLRKGVAYSLVLEETRGIRARVQVAGGVERALYSGAVIAADGATWTKIAAQYDAATGRMQILFDGRVVAEQVFPPAPLAGSGESLAIGGLGPRPACGGGGLNFAGTIDEVAVSRVVRYSGVRPPPPDAGPPDGPPGGVIVSYDGGSAGGCCQAGGPAGGATCLALVVLVVIVVPRRSRRARA